MVVMHYIKWLLSGQVAFLHHCITSVCCCVSGVAVMQVTQYKQEYFRAGVKRGGFLFHIISFGIFEHVRGAPCNSVTLSKATPAILIYVSGWCCLVALCLVS